jgi:hypothetical protein
MTTSEKQIEKALIAWKSGKYKSFRLLCREYNVHRTTLRERLDKETQSHQTAHESAQRLSRQQEEWLTRWIIHEDRKGLAPSYNTISEMAALICRNAGDTAPIGHNWIYSFLNRNPLVKPLVGRKIDAARINGSQIDQLKAHFELLKSVVSEFGIKSTNTYNMNEHGINQGSSANSKVVGEAARATKGTTMVKIPENREWVSIIECIGYSGFSTPPTIIFKGKNIQTTWFPLNLSINTQNWRYVCSQNGWTSNDIGLEWFRDVFLPSTIPS